MNTLFVGARVRIIKLDLYDISLGLSVGLEGEVVSIEDLNDPRGNLYSVAFEVKNPLYADQLQEIEINSNPDLDGESFSD